MSATTSSGSIQTRLGRRMCRFIGGGPLFAVAVITRCEDKLQVFDPHRATFENAQTRSAQDGNHIVQLDMTVSDAILETTLGLVAEQGLRSVTMLQIAEKTGIGRATLYKYFPDVEAILSAWHERHVDAHLKHLAAIRDQPGEPVRRLERVLEAYALIQQEHQGVGAEVTALLHRGQHVVRAQ